MVKTKVCPKCGVRKSMATGFYQCSARYDGVSSHCMVCHRKVTKEYDHTDKGKMAIRKRAVKAQAIRPHKLLAGKMVREAVRRGVLVRPDICPNCGRTVKTQAHHEDYAKPLEVTWLCSLCHKMRHGKLVAVDLIEQVTPPASKGKKV